MAALLPEAARYRASRRACIRSRSFQLSVHETIDAKNGARSTQCNQLDLFRISRFEPHRGAGRDVQPRTVSGISIEIQSTIHLEEMAVRSNLDGAIPAICYGDAGCGAPPVGFDRFVPEEVFSRDHFINGCALSRLRFALLMAARYRACASRY